MKTTKRADSDPLERVEVMIVAEYLDAVGALWFHTNNAGRRAPHVGRLMKRAGLKAGVPDILIFEHWADDGMRYSEGFGIAIEMKRLNKGRATPEQKQWLADLAARGWLTAVAPGANYALDILKRKLRLDRGRRRPSISPGVFIGKARKADNGDHAATGPDGGTGASHLLTGETGPINDE